MVSLLRKVRQKMLTQNRPFKYLLYAFGEILLVVIGILIALQVNDWNENRKNQKFERDILLLIDQNLQQDSILLTEELRKATMANELTSRLLEQVALKNYNDSLNIWLGKIISFERFKSQSSAFEVLKAKGFDVISDQQLQLRLISYYDVSLFEVYQSINDVEDSFKQNWNSVIKEDFSDFKWMGHCKPYNTKEFFEKPSSIVLFKLYQDNREGTIRNTKDALTNILQIRLMIKKHAQ